MSTPIQEAEVIPENPPPPAAGQTMAVARVEAGAVGRALTVDELHKQLEFIREVMRKEMTEGQDFGKIPGCGPKPTLLQPGAQKLLMTFNLTEYVKKETMRDYPNFHREYEFVICVKAPNGKEWDGVGTCSTLEAKYRYRTAERRCPECGGNFIIQGKAEYGGGWLCFKKKGGCGAKFAESDERITGQPGGTVEYDNPADYWNTVRKMAFKRGLVSAAINATNTSELWTQDTEEMAENARVASERSKKAPASPAGQQSPRQAPARAATPPPAAQPAPAAPAPACGTPKTRDWAILEVDKAKLLHMLPEYLDAMGQLLPTENLQDWPLRYVPVSIAELKQLLGKLKGFTDGDKAEAPFPAHNDTAQAKAEAAAAKEAKAKAPAPAPAPKPVEVPRDANPDPNSPTAPWRSFPLPFGKSAGTKLEDLDKKYLFGFAMNFKVETEYEGRPKKPKTIARDQVFRDMLDQAMLHYEWTKDPDGSPAGLADHEPGAGEPQDGPDADDDPIPF